MHELIQRLARDTGLLMKLESSETHTTVKAFDQRGTFLGLRTFSQRSFEDSALLEPALDNFAQLLRVHQASHHGESRPDLAVASGYKEISTRYSGT